MKKIILTIILMALLVIPACSSPTGDAVKENQYICDSNVYNCDNFKTHKEAQAVFESCGGVSNDVHHLDRDLDGLACETLS